MNMKEDILLASEERAFNSILLNMVLPGSLFFLLILAALVAKLIS